MLCISVAVRWWVASRGESSSPPEAVLSEAELLPSSVKPKFSTGPGVDGIPPGMNDSQYDFSQVQPRSREVFRSECKKAHVQLLRFSE